MKKMQYQRFHKHGFSLAELLIVITLIALLAIIALMVYQNQVARANDSKRKTDLRRFRDAFEDYYNDNDCYPDQTLMNDKASCDTGVLSPQIEKFPCDPTNGEPYLYVPIEDARGGTCGGYRILAALQDWSDPDILASGCSQNKLLGCGFSPPKYNYGISMGSTIARPGFDPNQTPPAEEPPAGGSVTGTISCNTWGDCNGFAPDDFTNGRCTTRFDSDAQCRTSGCPVSIRCNW